MGHWDHCWKCTRYQWVDWDPVTFVAALNVCAIVAAVAVEDCRCVLDSWKCGDSGTCEIWANPSWQMWIEGVQPNQVTFVGTLNVCGLAAPYLKRSSESTRSLLFLLLVAVDINAECSRCIGDAWRLSDRMLTHDVAAWLLCWFEQC
jgi:hypothetical protein